MPIISNNVQNNGGGSTPSGIRPQTRTYRSGNSTLTLREGQTLKGVVSDIHGNEITLSMEDGSSFTGKLPDANRYSIGQKAAFQITQLSDNTIYMKTTTGAYLLDMEDTVEQALEEANLPKSSRNLDVVRSLLQNQQSISRENIMTSIQLCAKYPEADVNAVITMKHLGLPMTGSSIRQFENYQNQTHQLLYKMDTLSDSIGDMLQSIGSQVPRLAGEVGSKLLNLILDGNPSLEEQQLTIKLAENKTDDNVMEGNEDETASSASAKEAPANDTATAAEQAADAGSSATESTGPLARMRQLFIAITDGSMAARNAMAESGMTEDYRTPFIHEQIGFNLSPEERTEFNRQIAELPLSENLKQAIAEGSATNRELLTQLQTLFPDMLEEQAGKLIASKAFQKVVKGQLMTNWTVSPEQLKEEGAMKKLYDTLSRQLDNLSHFSERVLGRDLFRDVSQNASDMSENMNFMKTLNQTIQYIQLPLKLQNQTSHGELYVMTKKEALKKNAKDLKVLLHLDMDYLGSLDIHITRENTAVSTKFFVSSEQTLHLLERNIELLQDAINNQGYAFHSEFAVKNQKTNVVKDFVSTEAPVGDIKRYNFDLRA